MHRRLILWDVDGTLVWIGQATRDAFDRAIGSVVRRAVGEHGVSFGGKTDPQIALEIMSELSIPDEEARGHLPGVLQALEQEMELAVDLFRQDGRVLPGIRDLLERFARRGSVVQSVLTGNIETTGRLKVGTFGLDRYLDLEVGAFGSDCSDRDQLVSVALDKLEGLRGWRPAPEDVWVVGDTALDLACARVAGARCLLVATGLVEFDVLASAGADAVLPDLGDVEAVEKLLLAPAVVTP